MKCPMTAHQPDRFEDKVPVALERQRRVAVDMLGGEEIDSRFGGPTACVAISGASRSRSEMSFSLQHVMGPTKVPRCFGL